MDKRSVVILGAISFILPFIFVFLGGRTFTLPSESQNIGPVTWKSNVDSASYVLNEDYSRQTTNDLVFEGEVSVARKISTQIVLVNFASRESGLQLVLTPSKEPDKMELLLIVRSDLPIDNACTDCEKPRHVVNVGSVVPDNKANSFLIIIRNNPGVFHVEFNKLRKIQPRDFLPEDVNLDVSYIEVGNPVLVSSKEEIALEQLKIVYSDNLRHVKVSYLLFPLLLLLITWRVFAMRLARKSQNLDLLARKIS